MNAAEKYMNPFWVNVLIVLCALSIGLVVGFRQWWTFFHTITLLGSVAVSSSVLIVFLLGDFTIGDIITYFVLTAVPFFAGTSYGDQKYVDKHGPQEDPEEGE